MENRIALITGGNKGIGYELVRQLAQSGYTVVLTARSEVNGQQVADQLQKGGFNVVFQRLDVTDSASISQTARFMETQYGQLHLLVNNAGIFLDEDADGLTVSMDAMQTTWETNTLGPLRVTQAMAGVLKKAGQAQVINISSGYGQLYDMDGGAPAAYKVSKTALNAVTRILAGDLAPFGVAVNAVCPGWVRTDMGGPSATRSPEESVNGIMRLIRQTSAPTGGLFRDGQPIPW